jgi:uncharacterized repeat protein (TIGR01451 family)
MSSKNIFLSLLVLAGILAAQGALAVNSPQVQTNSATNIQNASATLNANLSDLGGYGSATVWFEWGINTGYTNTTVSMNQSYTGSFSQQISNLSPNQTFHYRAVAQNGSGISYGQDVAFTTSQSGNSQITVNAGSNLYLNSGQSSVLYASAYDSQNSVLYYSWNCTGGTLSNYNILQPAYTAPYANQYSGQVSYTCTLTVTNAAGQSNTASAIIYVNQGGGSGSLQAQTNDAINISQNQATLQGYASGASYNTSVWFAWGTSTAYGNESNHQQLNYSGSFTQNIANLSQGQIYHFRAVAQNSYGSIVYGQDRTFTASGNGGYGFSTLQVTKLVRNLSSGSTGLAASVTAKPGDILQFSVTVQNTGSQTVSGALLKDVLPSTLLAYGSVATDTGYASGSLASGVYLGDLYQGSSRMVTYQAQVAPAANFSFGQTMLVNSASVTAQQGTGNSASVTVYVNRAGILGATNVSTGLTNNLLTESFFLPLVALVMGFWLWRSGALRRSLVWLHQQYLGN